MAVAKAMIAFLIAPKSLTIELAPPVPLSAVSLKLLGAQGPDKSVAISGLTVIANH